MLKSERQNMIMDIIKRDQYAKVADLKEEFGVSDETIRRDLAGLEKSGRIRSVHGGAVLETSTVNEFRFNVRARQNQLEKEAICAEAAKLVNERESIAILSSSTAMYMGDYLERKNNITVVTNSVYIAGKLSRNKAKEVILVGGLMQYDEQKTMGEIAQRTFKNVYVDKLFFSAAGISPERGITEYNEQESSLTLAAIGSAQRVIMLGDHTKFNSVAFRRVTDTGSVNDIVTDWHTPSDFLREYENMGITVHKAKK